jgi:cytochrome c peroxidase
VQVNKPAILVGLAVAVAMPVHAEISAKQTEVMNQLLATYGNQVKEDNKYLKSKGAKTYDKPFTAEAGRAFYTERRTYQSNEYTCSTCHTDDPKKDGKHKESKKPIKPLAPSVNPERFMDAAKVEREFREHCMDVHGRDCHPYEKANFIAYLMSVK